MATIKEQHDGFVVKSRPGGRVAGKLPFYCPRDECRRITDSLDDSYLKEYGVCAKCYIELVEDRKTPLIDVKAYRKRLQERGF
jgi:hypothetical protein